MYRFIPLCSLCGFASPAAFGVSPKAFFSAAFFIAFSAAAIASSVFCPYFGKTQGILPELQQF
jgi:hypothetical protein